MGSGGRPQIPDSKSDVNGNVEEEKIKSGKITSYAHD
jgi:hypothetical protein